jgi:Flp pilus assembly protein TadG
MINTPCTESCAPSRSVFRNVARCARRLLRAAPEQHGSGLIETAVVMPLFVLIVFGAVQYSIVLLTYCNATYACRLASRYASMHSNSSLAPDTVSQIQGLVTSRLFIGTAITPTVSVNYYTPSLTAGSNVVGNMVEVAVTWSQTVKLPFMDSSSFSISTQNYKVITR